MSQEEFINIDALESGANPNFSLLDNTTESIDQINDAKALSVSLTNAFQENYGLPTNYGIELAPYWFLKNNVRYFEKYTGLSISDSNVVSQNVFSKVKFSTVSVAYMKTATVDSISFNNNVSIGFKLPLLHIYSKKNKENYLSANNRYDYLHYTANDIEGKALSVKHYIDTIAKYSSKKTDLSKSNLKEALNDTIKLFLDNGNFYNLDNYLDTTKIYKILNGLDSLYEAKDYNNFNKYYSLLMSYRRLEETYLVPGYIIENLKLCQILGENCEENFIYNYLIKLENDKNGYNFIPEDAYILYEEEDKSIYNELNTNSERIESFLSILIRDEEERNSIASRILSLNDSSLLKNIDSYSNFLNTKLIFSKTNSSRDSIKAALDAPALFKVDITGASSYYFANSKFSSFSHGRTGFWLTFQFNQSVNNNSLIKKEKKFNNLSYIGILRILIDGFTPNPNLLAENKFIHPTKIDVGGKVIADFKRFSIGLEYLYRTAFLNKIEIDPTFRLAANMGIKISPDLYLSAAFGRDFGTRENIITVMGIDWRFFKNLETIEIYEKSNKSGATHYCTDDF